MEDGPAGEARLDYDAAEARMRVDETGLAEGDEKVLLRRTGAHEQHVATLGLSMYGRETCGEKRLQVAGNVEVAQRIAAGRDICRACSLEGASGQTNTIEARFRITAMQTEACAYKLFRMACEALDDAGHRGCGYWASKSLPGRCGSPWKLMALPNREAQVAMVLSQP